MIQSDTTACCAVFSADGQAAISISENLTGRKSPPGCHTENWSRSSIPAALLLLISSHWVSPGDSAEEELTSKFSLRSARDASDTTDTIPAPAGTDYRRKNAYRTEKTKVYDLQFVHQEEFRRFRQVRPLDTAAREKIYVHAHLLHAFKRHAAAERAVLVSETGGM